MKPVGSKHDQRVQFLLVSSFNLANLGAILSKDPEVPVISVAYAPFGQVMQTLLQQDGDMWPPDVRAAVVWASPGNVSAAFRRLIAGEVPQPQEFMADVDEFCSAITRVPGHVNYIFVPSWTVGPFEGRLGLADMNTQYGVSLALMRMNLRLAENLRDDPRAFVLDTSRWLLVQGEKSFNDHFWYLSKTPYSVEFFKVAALEIKAAIRALTGQSRKLILLDVDDTLWGGIVGEIGWQNLRLGGHDPIGEAFRDFQLSLKSLRQRGVLLGIVSKNEEATVLEAIRSHPEMALRLDDFAGWRINWDDKARNVADLTSELNLGLQSAVFIDDNAAERARVREALPEVFVPDWPGTAMEYASALQKLRCFDQPHISAEDRVRAEMYVAERKRREIQSDVGSLDQWLEKLEIRVGVEMLGDANLDRVEQLLNKTNQMNLSTRRLAKTEIWEWSQKPENMFLAFRVSDKYGDYGLVGIGSFSRQMDAVAEAKVVDFLLSCRVMGRKVEEVMLHLISACAKATGTKVLRLAYIPTSKNMPCLRFLKSVSKLNRSEDNVFILDLISPFPMPESIHLTLDPKVEAFVAASMRRPVPSAEGMSVS